MKTAPSGTATPYTAQMNLSGNFTRSGGTDSITTFTNGASGKVGRFLLNFNSIFGQTYKDNGNANRTRYVDFNIPSNTKVTLQSNLPVYPANKVTVNPGGYLDCANYSIKDSASSNGVFHLSNWGRLLTSKAGGVSAVTPSSNATYTKLDAGACYTFYNGGAQNTGFSSIVGNPNNIKDSVSGTQLTIDYGVTIQDTLLIGPGTSLIESGGNTITSAGSAKIVLNGNLDVGDYNGLWGSSGGSGVFSGFAYTDLSGPGSVRYTAGYAQQFSSGSYNNVSIMGGTNKTLVGDVTINGTLNLSSGNIIVKNHKLTMGSSSSITGASSSSFVDFDPTNTTGTMEANFTGNYTFPIGDSYNPITINNPGAATTFNVMVTNGITDRNGAALTDSAVNRTWTITPTAAVTGVTVTPQWDESTDLVGAHWDRSLTFVSYKPHSTSIWVPTQSGTASTNVSGTTYDVASGSFNMSAGAAYDMGVGSGFQSALPVTLLNFNAKKVNNYAALTWNTASEINNKGFEIERTFDAKLNNWTKIGFADGHGNSNVLNHYNYNDKENNLDQSIFPMVYYRLKQFDFNGTTSYSNIQAVACSNQSSANFLCYPNPVAQILNISWKNNAANATAIVKITDMMGKVVAVKSIVSQGNENRSYQVDMTSLLPGTYDVCIMSGNDTEHFSILKK